MPLNPAPKAPERCVSCVVPVFNSQTTLAILVAQLNRELSSLARRWEIILVNDGSSDMSWEIICQLAQQYPELRGINLMRNYGQHNALLCGIRACSYEITVTLDDDLQNPADEMEKLILKLEEGFDVVYGTEEKRQRGWLRNTASYSVRFLWQKLTGADDSKYISSYRAFRTHIRGAFEDFVNPSVAVDILLTWGAEKFSHVNVRHLPRDVGASHYSIGRLLDLASTMTTGLTTAPLRLASLNGIVIIGFGVAALAYVLISYIVRGGSIPGFPFLACLIIIFAGAQLIALGIIGEYVARIYLRMLDRPPYKVRSSVGQLNDHDHRH
ncbi:MAG: glycosyltransferase [Candidatus Melainabacteria bacterium]|nr:MAG: glycosyltransferase [Candidatus Melainabacteria bacterium]